MRARLAALACLSLTVALGLASRRWPLPGWAAEHTGDALYAVAAAWALALLFPLAGPGRWALGGLAASVLVELSQLVGWPWLQACRAHPLGALFLGTGFQWADLVAYVLGAALAWAWGQALRPAWPTQGAAPPVQG